MTSLLIAAFIMGALGSIHCIGMCGPIALSLPTIEDSHSSRFISTLLYNSGRIVTYSLLGAIFGSIGLTFHLFGFQQVLSLLLGFMIILFLLFPKGHFVKQNPLAKTLNQTRLSLGRLFNKKDYHSVFLIGILNGLLPCGLVYIAITGAIETASITKSSLFMAFFGLGTLPLMWTVSFFGGYLNSKVRTGIRKTYPYLTFILAILLILRGLDLNIPYLSPSFGDGNHIERIECHDDKQVNN